MKTEHTTYYSRETGTVVEMKKTKCRHWVVRLDGGNWQRIDKRTAERVSEEYEVFITPNENAIQVNIDKFTGRIYKTVVDGKGFKICQAIGECDTPWISADRVLLAFILRDAEHRGQFPNESIVERFIVTQMTAGAKVK